MLSIVELINKSKKNNDLTQVIKTDLKWFIVGYDNEKSLFFLCELLISDYDLNISDIDYFHVSKFEYFSYKDVALQYAKMRLCDALDCVIRMNEIQDNDNDDKLTA